jgi:hypothetical protein
MSDLIGQNVAGYPIEKVLGKGAYGDVYQAATSAQPLAVKILREELRGDKALNEAVAQGWEAARAATHPNLVTAFGAGVDPAHGAYCLQEIIQGKALRPFILQGSKVAWRDCMILAEQLFGALQALHAAGLCHGDIWPSNVLITQDQDLKLEGAGGLARLDRPPTDILRGPAIGYLAPEIIQGSPPSPASDLCSAGACLYFIMAGRDPFPGEDSEAVVRQSLSGKLTPLTAWREDVPPEAAEFISRLMARDPVKRYGQIGDVIVDLGRLKNGQPLAELKGGSPALAPVIRAASAPPAAESRVPPAAPSPAKTASGLRPVVAGSATKVFGSLDTHVKSTIPQCDAEKRGDDFYRQHQLPLALTCWKDAVEVAPHAALKVKIDLAERDLKKEAYSSAIDEAKHRIGIGDFKGGIKRAREAMLSAETPQQRHEAVALEGQAIQGAKQADKAASTRFAVMFGGFIVVAGLLFYLFSGHSDTGTATNTAPGTGAPSGGQGQEMLLMFKDGDVQARIAKPSQWTAAPSGSALFELRAPAGGTDRPAAILRVQKLPLGAAVRAKHAELRARNGLKDASVLFDEESFRKIDGTFACSRLGLRYRAASDGDRPWLHYFFVVAGPNNTAYQADFDGPEITFSAELQRQMAEIMGTWTYSR